MDSYLDLSPGDRRDLIEQAQAQLGLSAISIEKDYWVSLLLRELFDLPSLRSKLTFKGGTSLSKAWKLIERFSEDIDLTVDFALLDFGGPATLEGLSKTKRKQALESLGPRCETLVTTTIQEELQSRLEKLLHSDGPWQLTVDEDDRKTLKFSYPAVSAPSVNAYLKPYVKLEFGARSEPWPTANATITPLAAEAFPDFFPGGSCEVRVLAPERTFWEKAMLLQEENFRPEQVPPRPHKSMLARHYYDLWALIRRGVGAKAAADPSLLERVARDRELYYRQNWMDYSSMKSGAIRIAPTKNQSAWHQDYENMRESMFYGTPPSFDEVLEVVRRFEAEFNADG